MAGVIDYGEFAERLAAGRAAGPEQRWDLLRRFQAEWGYVPSEGGRWFGENLEEHQLVVRYLSRPGAAVDEWPVAHRDGVRKLMEKYAGSTPKGDPHDRPKIPAALTEWWLLPENSFADTAKLYWTNPEWPPTWRPDPSGYGVGTELAEDSPFRKPGEDPRLCVFMAEYQYCNEWGYLASEAHLDDPRVLVSVGTGKWVEQAPSISEFFLRIAADRLPIHFGWSAEVWDEDAETATAHVQQQLPDTGLLPWRELGAHTVIHGGPDVLVAVDSGVADTPPVQILGRTREALADLGRRIGVELEIYPPKAEDPHALD